VEVLPHLFYPPSLLVLLFFAVIYPLSRLHFNNGSDFAQIISHNFLIHHLDYRSHFGLNLSFWSVAIEVQLYALYPLFLALAAYFLRPISGLAFPLVLLLTAAIIIKLLQRGDAPLPILLAVNKWVSGATVQPLELVERTSLDFLKLPHIKVSDGHQPNSAA
jgi:peptidoglycan/LPS O-acetylase OafA/YrhL